MKMNGWINTELAAVNMAQVCRIQFFSSGNTDLVTELRLHCADGEAVRVMPGDPGFDDLVSLLADQGIEVAKA
jgi:hypothetical protein